MSFRSMLDQDISYFDNPSNPVGALCNRLANDASNVQSVTGVRVANVIKNFMTLIVALFIGFYYCPEVAGVALGFIPIIGIANMLQLRQLSGTGADKSKQAFEKAQNRVSESIRNIRSVTSLQCEAELEQSFQNEISQGLCTVIYNSQLILPKSNLNPVLSEPVKLQKHNALMVGIFMGMTDAVLFFAYALCFWFGGWLIEKDNSYESKKTSISTAKFFPP